MGVGGSFDWGGGLEGLGDGREGFVVERVGEDKQGPDGVVLGVVARSAGVWENEKVVCACSGKTVWEEREEMVGRGYFEIVRRRRCLGWIPQS